MNARRTRTGQVGTAAVSDHLSRLYEGGDELFTHVDVVGAVIWLGAGGQRATSVTMTDQAVAEFRDDLDYQIEFTDEPLYKAQCRRARKALDRLEECNV